MYKRKQGWGFVFLLLMTCACMPVAWGNWSTGGSLATARETYTATLLPSGKVLAAGGSAPSGSLSSAELYDPTTNTWSAAGTLGTGRADHTATLLPFGKVLAAGGYVGGGAALASAELYDPVTNSWSTVGTMGTARSGHTATLLPSGKVPVAGGYNGGGLASAELYDPAINSWSVAGALASARYGHTATLLPSGKVLVAGGEGASALTSAELYDPATNSWSTAGPLATARTQHTATTLPSGKVLVAGGIGASTLTSAELYDPATNSWSAAASLGAARAIHTATLLPSGKVLVAAGYVFPGHVLNSAELYDPATNSWSVAASLGTARASHTATLLPSGKVLVAAGGDSYFPLASAELYDSPHFVSTNPARLLDTRVGYSTIDSQFAGIGMLNARSQVDLTVAGRAGVPLTAKAVVLNVTVTNPTAASYITTWPAGAARPLASSLNFVANQTIPNMVIASIGANGEVSLYNAIGQTDLIADVTGYFDSAADLVTLTPSRLLDTRAGSSTIDGQFQGIGALSAGGKLDLTIAGRAGIPGSDVGAAILNVTAVTPSAAGFLTVWPSDAVQPLTSNLNFAAGDIIPNLVISKVGAAGNVSIFNSSGNTDVVADVAGWFPQSSQLTPLVPARLMDTRAGAYTIDGQFAGSGALAASSTTNLGVLGRGGVPASGVDSVVLNVTVTSPTAAGYLTVWPTAAVQPNASNLNFVANQTIPNLVIAKIGSGGNVAIFTGTQGTTQVVVDVVGWFSQ